MTGYGYLTGRIVDKLRNVQQTPSGIRATCPAHEDHHPSLDVDERGGKLLLCCRAGCDQKRVIEALGLRASDLDEDAASREEKRTTKLQHVASYRYGTSRE
jgi:hypothetical protein